MLKRKTPMKRSVLLQKSPHKRTAAQGGDEPYLRWIRRLPCCICSHTPPNDAHHITGAGMSLKAPDRTAIPLCRTHHGHYHDGRGYFLDMGRIAKREWHLAQVTKCEALWIAALAKQIADAPRAGE
jgi:hypothetical protein